MTKSTLPDLLGVRRQVLLSAASHWLGTSPHLLQKEITQHGYPILGNGRGRRVFIEDVMAVQQLLEDEARGRMAEAKR